METHKVYVDAVIQSTCNKKEAQTKLINETGSQLVMVLLHFFCFVITEASLQWNIIFIWLTYCGSWPSVLNAFELLWDLWTRRTSSMKVQPVSLYG